MLGLHQAAITSLSQGEGMWQYGWGLGSSWGYGWGDLAHCGLLPLSSPLSSLCLYYLSQAVPGPLWRDHSW